jgi:hypothetical protein
MLLVHFAARLVTHVTHAVLPATIAAIEHQNNGTITAIRTQLKKTR